MFRFVEGRRRPNLALADQIAILDVFKKLTLRRRRQLLVTLAACFILIVGPYVVSRVRSAGRQIRVHSETAIVPTHHVSTIRVLTYNIAHGRGATDDNWQGTVTEKRKRIEDIARSIAKAEADIVVLNEVDFSSTWSGRQNQAQTIARLCGYSHWVEQRNFDLRFIYGSWKFGNAILSRFPIADVEIVKFPTLKRWERLLAGCKQGVVCTIRLSPSQEVRILAVHLDDRSEDLRVSSAKMIVDLVESSAIPLIAAGDFNSTPSEFPDTNSSTTGQNAMDILKESQQFELYAKTLPSQNEMTYSSTRPTRVIDWVLIPSGWRFAEYLIVPSELSDHRAVIATVEVPINSPAKE